MQQRDPKQDDLAKRLRAYAHVRLSPEPSATTRMRARVMAAAHRQAALQRADADRAAARLVALAQADRTRRSTWRRPLTALLAAGLTLGVGVGSVAAAQPGGPLYPVRIWTESLTLPTNASERAQAELRRLEERLAEAAAATVSGDLNATNAALDAYGAIVGEATNDVGNDVSAAATLDTGLRSNVDVLTVLVDRVPTEQARDAIQRAIERSDSARDEIHGKSTGAPNNTAPGTTSPAAKPSRSPEATERSDPAPNPNAPTPTATDPTPKPHPTKKPKPTPDPAPADRVQTTPAEPAHDGPPTIAGGSGQ